MTSSPYATGGGGVVLEHRYGAVLLGCLLTGNPIPELGDDAVPVSVRFQAASFSPVDDLLLTGRTPDGSERRASVGVRRAPRLVPSDRASVALLASYLAVISNHWDELHAGRWRLALAVAGPNAAVRQASELAVIARTSSSDEDFRRVVSVPGRVTGGVRNRLARLDELVEAVVAETGTQAEVRPRELLWRLLSGLRVREIRLEGTDEADRTSAVSGLRALMPDHDLTAADRLFGQLAELVSRYAPTGAHVTEPMLRRDLSGTPLGRSPTHGRAWEVLDRLADRLLQRTDFRLESQAAGLELERAETRDALVSHMTAAGTGPGAVIVVGEPDVGKSALTLRAAQQLEAGGAAVTTMSLRDLPHSMLEFEAALGAPFADVLGSAASAKTRLLVIDGAEAVLEGRAPLLTDLAAAALQAGSGVVAVTRADGGRAVADLIGAAAASGLSAVTGRYEVPRLTPTEVSRVLETFPFLAQVAADRRADWLLARPGLVDLLLRAGSEQEMPAGPLSEADLFAVVWQRLVRDNEIREAEGPSPDARERSLIALARQLLLPDRLDDATPEVDALPSLRSDGLLLAPGPTSAWNPRDEFASDLIRDMSVARLLITDGWGVLDEAGAPRWTLRAVRVACQATLAREQGTEQAWRDLQDAFTDLATRHGTRWSEIPTEALLTLGSADEALSRAWPSLLAGEREGIRTIVRLGLQRFSEHGFGDPIVLAPLVRLAYGGDIDLGQDDRYSRDELGEEIRDVVLAWLRGLVTARFRPLGLRQQVRDRLLARTPDAHDEFAVEALAMLGPDLDDAARRFLLRLAEERGAFLAPAVESVACALAMSAHQPELLMALADAYYIERPRHDDYGWSGGLLDDGIRRHQKAGGIGVPMAAWYFGPFFSLLNARPSEALAFINRMLDHAAAARVQHLGLLQGESLAPESRVPGLDLELPGVGTRRCVGDAHVWSWYRGSSVGPYPCMSALLAVERFADHLVEIVGLPLDRTVEVLLRDCHNLAMPGLVVGLLVRHLDRAGDLLDGWLARPELWHLEFSRVANEGHLHIQGPDSPELVGRERRAMSLRDVAAEVTLRATLAGDDARLAILASIGDELVQRARSELNASGDDLIAIEGWAATFRPENYHPRETDDGQIVIEYQHPERIATRLAPGMAALARGSDAYRLQFTYARAEDRVAPVETLAEDLERARELAANPPESGPPSPDDAVTAVAASAIVAHAQGRASVAEDDLRWSADVVIEASRPVVDDMSFYGTIYPMGADRSSAVALPLLLTPTFDPLAIERPALHEALHRCATSPFDEVRLAFARGVAPIWVEPCNAGVESKECRHRVAWQAVREGLRDCRLGRWDQERQRRARDPLAEPYEETLRTIPTDRLLVNQLTAAVVAAADAATSASCVADEAQLLLDVLLDTFRRGWGHWSREGYGEMDDRWRAPVVRVLLESAAAGDDRQLITYIQEFSSNARALDQLLHDLRVLFTYDEALRASLLAVWRQVMIAALDAFDRGADLRADHYWADDALAGLLPTPQIDIADTDLDSTLARARTDWLPPDEISDLVARWLPIARREPRTVDAVVQLAQCATHSWQATTGLRWAEELIDGDYHSIARRCWFLIDWLESVRASGNLDAQGTSRWRRLVDGLVSAGDDRAVKLQQTDE